MVNSLSACCDTGNEYGVVILCANWLCKLVVQTGLCKLYVQIGRANSMCKLVVQTLCANSMCKLVMQTGHAALHERLWRAARALLEGCTSARGVPLAVFRWFKFTLKPPIVVAIGNLGHFLLEIILSNLDTGHLKTYVRTYYGHF